MVPKKFSFTWQPNNTDTEIEFVRDWRGRCFELQRFQPIQNASENPFKNIGVALLNCIPSSRQMNGHQFDIHTVFVPVCLLHGALKRTFFSSSETHLKQFVSRVISLFAVSEKSSLTSRNCSSTTVDVIENFATNSTVLPKQFKAKCREILSSRKHVAKVFFFEALEYYSIFPKQNAARNVEFESSSPCTESVRKVVCRKLRWV